MPRKPKPEKHKWMVTICAVVEAETDVEAERIAERYCPAIEKRCKRLTLVGVAWDNVIPWDD